jgi:chromosome segregation and condensation protein ScpB
VGLLERNEELSRTRARLARETLIDLAPRLRRRATLLVRSMPTALREALEADAGLVRTGLEHPPLGLAVQRHSEEFSLVTAPKVSASIERHLGNPRPVALSRAALEVLAIVARAGVELIRGSAGESAVGC